MSLEKNSGRFFISVMFKPRIVRAAIKVAAIVGTVLNLINNGEQIWSHHVVNVWPIAMNYLVPFCVSSYSAARNELQRAIEG